MLKPLGEAKLALLFSLNHDFPSEWAAFVGSKTDALFTATIRRDFFPYFAQGKTLQIDGFDLYDGQDVTKHKPIGDQNAATEALNDPSKQEQYSLNAPEDEAGRNQVLTRKASAKVFLVIRYSFG